MLYEKIIYLEKKIYVYVQVYCIDDDKFYI